MNLSEAVGIIQSRLGNRVDSDLQLRIISELDLAQYELERSADFTPWFLLSETARYTMIVGEQRVPIPSDMLHEYEEGALFYGNRALKKKEYETLRKAYHDAVGEPEAYAFVGKYFIVFPTPDAAYRLDMKYYKSDIPPSRLGDSGLDTNAWLTHAADWLLAKAGSAVARFIRDNEAAALFIADEQRAAERVHKTHIRWMEENIERRMWR